MLAFAQNEAASWTFADRGENGPGMRIEGTPTERHLSVEDLEMMKMQFEGNLVPVRRGVGEAEMYYLNPKLGPDAPETEQAAVLVCRNFVDVMLGEEAADQCMHETALMKQRGHVDKQSLMRGQVKNKNARWNNTIGVQFVEPDIARGQGTVVSFDDYPVLSNLEEVLKGFQLQGAHPTRLIGELNLYYDVAKCGIGFHGDRERDLVAGLRLGKATDKMTMMFQGYYKGVPTGEMTRITLNHGDVYFLSHKAIGTDWLHSSKVTWRHAAGSDTCPYSKLKKPKAAKKRAREE
tara:strand:+ start:519 stop:1394 length:876 start_codon:yes stop_codon:yes gene_type:complete